MSLGIEWCGLTCSAREITAWARRARGRACTAIISKPIHMHSGLSSMKKSLYLGKYHLLCIYEGGGISLSSKDRTQPKLYVAVL
jgi:hypothetical protein